MKDVRAIVQESEKSSETCKTHHYQYIMDVYPSSAVCPPQQSS